MIKQEEIREELAFGIAEILWSSDTHKGNNTIIEAYLPVARAIMSSLHSQGVVIKVERELPKHIVQEFSCEYDNGYHEAQMDILKAGYVAVEPLIEETTK